MLNYIVLSVQFSSGIMRLGEELCLQQLPVSNSSINASVATQVDLDHTHQHSLIKRKNLTMHLCNSQQCPGASMLIKTNS